MNQEVPGMLESDVIAYCAPTLAGLKTANMFSYKPLQMEGLDAEIRRANGILNEKGVFIEVLKSNDARALLYVYRRKKLEADLKREGARRLLEQCGYGDTESEACIGYLKTRFSQYRDFPHEVGLFLGYPLHDVVGFIEQKGQNYKCTGIWKVYDNEKETQQTFRKLKKCTEIYRRLFAGGRSIRKLTVAVQ